MRKDTAAQPVPRTTMRVLTEFTVWLGGAKVDCCVGASGATPTARGATTRREAHPTGCWRRLVPSRAPTGAATVSGIREKAEHRADATSARGRATEPPPGPRNAWLSQGVIAPASHATGAWVSLARSLMTAPAPLFTRLPLPQRNSGRRLAAASPAPWCLPGGAAAGCFCPAALGVQPTAPGAACHLCAAPGGSHISSGCLRDAAPAPTRRLPAGKHLPVVRSVHVLLSCLGSVRRLERILNPQLRCHACCCTGASPLGA